MYPVSAKFLAEVRGSHVSVVKVEIYNASTGESLASPQPIDGSVTIDNRRSVRRQVTADFIDKDGTLIPLNKTSSIFLPYNREMKVWRGVQYADGTQELIPLGVFVINKISITDTPQGVKLTVSGDDRSLYPTRSHWANDTFYISSGTAKETAIQQILKDRYPSVQTIFPITGQVTPFIYPTLDKSSDPWREALKIAQSASLDLYFDANGVTQMRQIPDPDLGIAVASYADGVNSVLTQLKRDLDTIDTYNGIIFTGEGTNLTIGVIGEAWDSNPSSPTYRYGSYGEVPKFMSSPTVLTVGEAQLAAATELKKVIGASEAITWDALVNPAHDVFDVVQITRPASGVYGYMMLDSITIPLSPSVAMTALGRTRRF